ncbi:glutamate--cysteine ligase [Robbsia sp. Bb-Pol-6]|uniref:Glutamate--cysteine ligase n=1 Tax=Robbsia betulipollinis TaxID=2981849 RepID=A0ABT3ZTE0_9BURK|nr:glutamate--cysteine ligase [Robbsia betulipollinis]MCY0389195.1 glutamate--cysteine ligase [Robbsia betulipollinis]
MKTTTSTKAAGGFARRLELLRQAAKNGWLAKGKRGIEKESLRVTQQGTLADSAHPSALGAALTHPELTTDYSESLLEFITPPVADPVVAVEALQVLHAFVHRRIGDELLWDVSMPGHLPPDPQIPIAQYGSSNQGRFKHVYRHGLSLRYGRKMQCIAGIHYNFSLHEDIWPLLHGPSSPDDRQHAAAPDDIQSASYMALIRNYRRFSWLLLYLFGASPALDRSFFGAGASGAADAGEEGSGNAGPNGLQALGEDTLYLPHATSLRMSDLGYHNRAASGSGRPDLRSLRAYLAGLADAVRTPHAPYEALGTHRDGKWVQLNGNLLQIENELYATIRPKRVGEAGERVLQGLTKRGIQYVEVRCLDIDPFEPAGIGATTVRFLDAFLTMCVLEDSPADAALQAEADANFLLVAKSGRQPGKMLECEGQPIALHAWAEMLLERIEAAARVLDESSGMTGHTAAVAAQRAKLADPSSLPSARALADIVASGSFAAFGLRQSRAHAAHFLAAPLAAADEARLLAESAESIARQRKIEARDDIDFDAFMARHDSGRE